MLFYHAFIALLPLVDAAVVPPTLFSATDPFPDWLQEITNLTEWPTGDPPYIPDPNIDLENLPEVERRSRGVDCTQVSRDVCSFECHGCLEEGDIKTCSSLIQTFDDGPTPATLDLLTTLRSRTTFFTLGKNVVAYPGVFRMQHAMGHLMASHTWSHKYLPSLSNEEIAAEIQWSIWAMNATAGIVPKYFRPPFGATDIRVRAITRQFNLVNVFWDKDTFDWRLNDDSKTQAEVIQDASSWQSDHPSGIMLEHDSTRLTVAAGRLIHKILTPMNQLTVADCAADPEWYQYIHNDI